MAKLTKKRYISMLWRTFALVVAIVLFSLLISGVFLLILSSSYWKEWTLDDLASETQHLSDSISRSISYYDTDDSLASEEVYRALSSPVHTVAAYSGCEVLIIGTDGRVLLCGECDPDSPDGVKVCEKHADLLLDTRLREEITSAGTVTFGKGKLDFVPYAEDYIAAANVVKMNGQARCFVLLLKAERLAFRELSAKYSGMVIFSSSVAVGLSFIAAYVVSYRIVSPLRKISEATQQYAKGNFSVRIDTSDTYNEIRDLADSVNSMAEDLSVIEESRSNFVANISHELKTPMTIISGFIDGILDGTIDPSEREKYLVVVSDETKRLSRLVVDMLNMSKIEAGKLTLNLSTVELSSLLLKILLIYETTLSQNNISVNGLDSLTRTTITADEGLIYQVFFNIIDNAVKFTPENGSITVSMESGKKNVAVTVRNTGKGIPEEDRGRIFERFYKVDKSRGLDSRSFGIGLPIAKSIVELHNGSICINSVENEYTEFVVTLPVEPGKE